MGIPGGPKTLVAHGTHCLPGCLSAACACCTSSAAATEEKAPLSVAPIVAMVPSMVLLLLAGVAVTAMLAHWPLLALPPFEAGAPVATPAPGHSGSRAAGPTRPAGPVAEGVDDHSQSSRAHSSSVPPLLLPTTGTSGGTVTPPASYAMASREASEAPAKLSREGAYANASGSISLDVAGLNLSWQHEGRIAVKELRCAPWAL
jgi:hypothetical protein